MRARMRSPGTAHGTNTTYPFCRASDLPLSANFSTCSSICSPFLRMAAPAFLMNGRVAAALGHIRSGVDHVSPQMVDAGGSAIDEAHGLHFSVSFNQNADEFGFHRGQIPSYRLEEGGSHGRMSLHDGLQIGTKEPEHSSVHHGLSGLDASKIP